MSRKAPQIVEPLNRSQTFERRGLRILHIDTGRGWRGGQQQLFWLLEGLRAHDLEQGLLAPKDSPLAARVREQGGTVAEVGLPATSLASVRQVRRQAAGFDLLHAHDSHAHTLAWLASVGKARKSRKPLVVSRRVAFPIGRLSGPKYAAADIYIAVSEYVRQRLLQAGVPAPKIRVVYDGVAVPAGERRAAWREKFRRSHQVGEDTLLLGTLTSMAPEKRLREEMDLLAELPPRVHLWLARPAAEPQAEAETLLRQHARTLGVENRMRIFSLGDGVEEFLAALDVFVYLSESEGLGSAILLAMAHELPVVASSVGGIPEIVRHQETGLLIPPDRKKDWAEGVRPLLDSQDLRQHFGSAGRQFVLAHATCEIMAAQTAAVYRELFRESR